MRIETKAESRKGMAQAIADFLGEEMHYAGAPSFAYQIGKAVVNRDGSITSEADELEERLMPFLIREGYAEEEPMEINITIPAEDFTALNIRNLVFMIASREYLLNKALGGQYFGVRASLAEILTENPVDSKLETIEQIKAVEGGLTGITITETEIIFTFPSGDPDENAAYTELAAAMAKRAKEATRIRPERHEPENEKYYFRAWLVSIGFAGDPHKISRKVLLKRLQGHSAFKDDAAAEKFKEAMKEKRRLAKEGGDQA